MQQLDTPPLYQQLGLPKQSIGYFCHHHATIGYSSPLPTAWLTETIHWLLLPPPCNNWILLPSTNSLAYRNNPLVTFATTMQQLDTPPLYRQLGLPQQSIGYFCHHHATIGYSSPLPTAWLTATIHWLLLPPPCNNWILLPSTDSLAYRNNPLVT